MNKILSLLVLMGVASEASAYCVNRTRPSPAFLAAPSLPVFYVDDGGSGFYDLTVDPGESPKPLGGSKGIEFTKSEIPRYIQQVIHEVNNSSADLKLTYGGTTTSSKAFSTAGPSGIYLTSVNEATFESLCGTGAAACEIPIGNLDRSIIYFHPEKNNDIEWQKTIGYGTNKLDWSGALTHEMLHSFGVFHSNENLGCTQAGGEMDGFVEPASIMNTDYFGTNGGASGIQVRYLMRDDIEALRVLKGTRTNFFSALESTDGDNWYSIGPGAVVSSRAPLSASNAVPTSIQNEHVLGSTSSDDSVVVTSTTGGTFASQTIPSSVSFQRVGVAVGGGQVVVVWVDESDKSLYVPPVMSARRAESSSTWTLSPLKVIGVTDVTTFVPNIALGFDDASGRFLLTTIGSGVDRKTYVSTFLPTSSAVSFGTPVGSSDHHFASKAVCSGGSCSLVYGRVDDFETTARQAIGHVSSVNFVVDNANAAPKYRSLGELDQGRAASGNHTLSFAHPTSPGRWVGRKVSASAGVDQWTSFSSPSHVAVGSIADYVGFPGFGYYTLRHRLYFAN